MSTRQLPRRRNLRTVTRIGLVAAGLGIATAVGVQVAGAGEQANRGAPAAVTQAQQDALADAADQAFAELKTAQDALIAGYDRKAPWSEIFALSVVTEEKQAKADAAQIASLEPMAKSPQAQAALKRYELALRSRLAAMKAENRASDADVPARMRETRELGRKVLETSNEFFEIVRMDLRTPPKAGAQAEAAKADAEKAARAEAAKAEAEQAARAETAQAETEKTEAEEAAERRRPADAAADTAKQVTAARAEDAAVAEKAAQ